ncbi:MAG: RipA family octameric membrane protein [Pseudomonadales bacterium]
MKIFVIHRSSERRNAEHDLNTLKKKINIPVNFIFLKESLGKEWQSRASTLMAEAEFCIIYDPQSAKESPNVNWEIEKAEKTDKRIVDFKKHEENIDLINYIKSIYFFEVEFESHFSHQDNKVEGSIIELYKIMISSSESLMTRRQGVNSFFWTVVAAIFAATGYLWTQKIHLEYTSAIFIIPLALGVIICHSWSNLIINYGRLNRGKYKVINQIEKIMPISIFSAEWVALGKGVRPDIYQSFTETEAKIPKILFFIFLILLTIFISTTIFSNFENIKDWMSFHYFIFFKCY